jgi:tryptophanyl-tRNA synthetase
MGWGSFKPLLADAAVEALKPLQARYREWRKDPASVRDVLCKGQEKAASVATDTLDRVRNALGLLPSIPADN